MPTDAPGLRRLKAGFLQMANPSIPDVIGLIDCTHVKIASPGGPDAELYRNRKGYFSINVQAVGSYDLQVLDVEARWYGSAHDSNISIILQSRSVKFKQHQGCKFSFRDYRSFLYGKFFTFTKSLCL